MFDMPKNRSQTLLGIEKQSRGSDGKNFVSCRLESASSRDSTEADAWVAFALLQVTGNLFRFRRMYRVPLVQQETKQDCRMSDHYLAF